MSIYKKFILAFVIALALSLLLVFIPIKKQTANMCTRSYPPQCSYYQREWYGFPFQVIEVENSTKIWHPLGIISNFVIYFILTLVVSIIFSGKRKKIGLVILGLFCLILVILLLYFYFQKIPGGAALR